MPKFLSNINLSLNEIENVVIDRVTSDPTTGLIGGRMIYRSDTDDLKYYEAGTTAAWVTIGSGGGGGGLMDDWTISDGTTSHVVNDAEIVTFSAGANTGISVVVGGTATAPTVTISGENASTSSKGVASFNSAMFSVTTGAVSIANGGVDTAQIADDAVTYAKIQNVSAQNRVLGSTTAGGVVSEVQVNNDMIANTTITNAKISATAAIADTKLNTIATANKVSLSALNISGATDIGGTILSGDILPIYDVSALGNRRTTVDRIATLFAGTGLTATNAEISVDYGTSSTTALRGDTAVDTVSVGNLKSALASDLGGGYTIGDANDTGTVSGNFIISGDLTVNGTTTSVNSNTVNIGDNIIVLNSDETGTPSQNAGIEVERGTASNVQIRWNEADDDWEYTAFDHQGTPAIQTYKIPRTFSDTIGDASATSINVDHNLGQTAVLVQLFDTSTGETVFAEVTRTSINRVVCAFAVAPGSGAITVLISTV